MIRAAAVLCLAVSAAGQGFAYTYGKLAQARAGQAAIVLRDGDVLLVGGEDNGHALASAALYDPATQTFSPTGSMTTPRLHPQAQPLPDGRVLVMGGGAPGAALTSEIYDPAAGTFAPGPSLPVSLSGIVTTQLSDGRIFLAGVENCEGDPSVPCAAPIYIFNPRTLLFSPAGALPLAVEGEAAVTLADGNILLYSGFPAFAGPTSPLNQFQIFDPARGKTGTGNGPPGSAVAWGAATRLHDGTVLICGGANHQTGFDKACELFKASGASVTFTASPMLVGRNRETMTLLSDGRVLVAGGGNAVSPDAELYDPAAQTFSSAGNFNTERQDFTASLLPGGSVLFAGGEAAGPQGPALASAELFSPAPAAPTFSLSASPSLVTVNTSSAATFQITASADAGFSSSVALTCGGNSSIQCVFAPAMVSPAASSVLTVTGFDLSQGGLVKFDVNGSSGSLQYTLPLEIALEPPLPTLSPGALSFGDEMVGQKSGSQTVSLANAGEGTLHIARIATSGDFTEANNCPTGLADGAPACSITVVFAPSAPGARSGTLTIADDAPFSPQAVQLSGIGEDPPAPAVALAPPALQFGQQTVGASSAARNVTLTNSGNISLAVSFISITGPFTQTNDCSAALNPGATCTVAVVFEPSMAGNATGALTIADNAPASPQTVALSGTATSTTPVIIQPAPSSSTTATVSAGQTASYNLQLSSSSGFAGAVALTCSGAPPGATCSAHPATLTLGALPGQSSGQSMVTISVSTSGGAGAALPPSPHPPPPLWPWLGLLSLPLVFALMDRRWRPCLRIRAHAPVGGMVVALVFALALVLAACGGGSTNPPLRSLTPAGSYTLSLTAVAAGATVGSTQLMLIVR